MNRTRNFRRSKLALGLFAALATAPVFAQSTSAGVGGQVTNASGQPVAGAEVVITHVESGTTSRAVTDANGRYVVRGLRVGGPYTVTATNAGQTDTERNVYLALDTVNSVDLGLAAAGSGSSLGAVTVVGTGAAQLITPESTGAATTITREQIENLPSVRRSLEDYVRLDPRIVQVDKERGGIAAAGQNNRYNNIRIDGVPTNDNFGLNDSGVPALNQPIVIDWIQEFNVSVSNYDVTQGDFVGANVNAVTKSGTNTFRGSVYGLYRDADMIGDWVGNAKRPAPYKSEKTYGAYLGGPIIKDRLFFFAGYEKFERQAEAISNGVAGSGALNEFRLTQAELNQILTRATALGATQVGSFAPINNIANTDTKKIVKIDWNINEDHRAAFRYNKTEGDVLRQNTSTSVLQADSNRYLDNISFENWAGMLYSDWNDTFSSEATVSYSKYRSLPRSFSTMPQVSITVPNASPTGGTATVLFGQERSRQSNQLAVDTWTGFFAGNLYLGNHEVKFGADYENSDVYNLFLQDTVGNYTFGNTGSGATFVSGFQNFLNGRYTAYSFQRARSGNNADAAANFKIGNLGLFLQDTWTVNDNLTLIYGIRADQTLVGNTPAANAQFRADYGIDNTNTPKNAWTFSPRFGFNYTTSEELRTQVRGGIGLFVGSAPGVWLSNSFSNPGVLVDSYSIPASTGAPVPPNALASGTPTLGGAVPAQLVNAMAGDFKQPTIWKANLAVDQELPWMGMVASLEILTSKTQRGVHYVNYATGAPTGKLPDGRNHYWSNTALGTGANIRAACLTVTPSLPFNRTTNPCRYTNAIVLRNTDGGRAHNVTVSLEKPWSNDWFAKLALTLASSTEVSPGTSSVALSNWSTRVVFNQDEDVAHRSNYEVDRRLTFALSKRFRWFGDRAATKVSMFYEGRHGRPYSYVFGNDANGDGVFGNDTFFVPAPGGVAFTANTSAADQTAFFNYIAGNKDLSRYVGSAIERNAGRSPWRNIIDLRLQQDLPLFWGAKASLFLDIENFGNLLNKKWGHVQEAGFPYTVSVANYAGTNAQGQYVYDAAGFANRNNALPYRNFESRWMAQLGLRIDF